MRRLLGELLDVSVALRWGGSVEPSFGDVIVEAHMSSVKPELFSSYLSRYRGRRKEERIAKLDTPLRDALLWFDGVVGDTFSDALSRMFAWQRFYGTRDDSSASKLKGQVQGSRLSTAKKYDRREWSEHERRQ